MANHELAQHFTFLSDSLYVVAQGPVWVSPCNGRQHGSLREAVTAECRAMISASGDDPMGRKFRPAIERAIEDAEGGREIDPREAWDEVDDAD